MYNENLTKLKGDVGTPYSSEIDAVIDNVTEHINDPDVSSGTPKPIGDLNAILQQLLNNDGALKVLADALEANKANKTTQVIAGNGLTGGGDLSTNRTFNIASANPGIVVNADNIELKPATPSVLGGMIVGDNLTVDGAGRVSTPKGTDSSLGVTKGGNYTQIDSNGAINGAYTSLSELGLVGPKTALEIASAMPDKTILFVANGTNDVVSDAPEHYGFLYIVSDLHAGRSIIEYRDPLGKKIWSLKHDSTNLDVAQSLGWREMLGKDNVINNLTSDNVYDPLSAKMGKHLEDTKFENIGIEIPAGVDLNTYRTCGHYMCKDNVGAGTILNSPFGDVAFTLIVDSISGGGVYVVQTATAYNTGKMKTRYTINGGAYWYPWVADLTENSPPVPVGGILVMADNTSPADKYPGTTWSTPVTDGYLRGGTQSTVNQTGGQNGAILTQANLPNVNLQIHFEGSDDSDSGDAGYYAVNDVYTNYQGWYQGQNYAALGGSGTSILIEPFYIRFVAWKRLS